MGPASQGLYQHGRGWVMPSECLTKPAWIERGDTKCVPLNVIEGCKVLPCLSG